MTDIPLHVSVVICAYTEARWDSMMAGVASLQSQTIVPLEIIVVIDHNPRLLERARAHLPGLVVVENHEPRGASGSKNSGVAAAKGELIAFLDDDAVAAPDWLEHLMAGFGDPHVIGVGGMTIPMWLNERPDWFPEEFYWVFGCTHRGMPETTAAVRNLIACNMCVRREAFAAGGFRSGIGPMGGRPLGCEETEFGIRVRQRWPEKIWLHNPEARVWHQVPASRASWRYLWRRCYGEGLSKALVSQFVGAKDGLASERAYTLRTLPRGVARGIADGLFHYDLAGFARSGAIIVGLAAATLGYVVGTLSHWLTTPRAVFRRRGAAWGGTLHDD